MIRTMVVGMAAYVAAGFLSAAQADSVVASDPDDIVTIIQNMGYKASLETDAEGDPKIQSSAAGSTFQIYFYGCTDNAECRSVQFSSGYDLTNGTNAAVMNDWNRRKRFGRAFIDDEGDPWIKLDLNLDEGGTTIGNFQDTFEVWELLLGQFEEHIDW